MNATRGVLISMLGAAALAVIALPGQRPDYRMRPDPVASRVRSASVRLSAQVEHWRIADSRAVARHATRASTATRDAVEFASAPPGASGFANNIRFLAMREAKRMPRRDTSVRITVAFAIDTGAVTRYGDAGMVGASWSADAFVPVKDSVSTCTVVIRAHRPSYLAKLDTARLRQYGGVVLGPCAWYGAYGLPGRGLAAWFDSTKHGALVNASRTYWPRQVRYRGDAFDAWAWEMSPNVLLACLAKHGRACEQIVSQTSDRRSWRDITVSHADGASWGRHFYEGMSAISGWMLNELEREIGPDGFRSFWKSDLPLPEAFAAARGEPLSEWIGREITAMYAPYRPGPLPATRTSFALLLAVPGFIALGLYAVRQRATFA